MTETQHGFTLLELLLAMTVFGVVVAMLSLSLSGSMRVVEDTEREDAILLMAQTAMRRITEDLAAAFAAGDEPFEGKSALEDGHRADSLRLCSQAHLVFNPNRQHPGPALIEYRLEKDEEDGRKYRLLRSDEPLLPGLETAEETETATPPAFVLADNLRSLQFTYFDSQGQETDDWQAEDNGKDDGKGDGNGKGNGDSDDKGKENGDGDGKGKGKENGDGKGTSKGDDSDSKGKLPAAVHCILEFWIDADEDSVRMFSTRIVLPVGASGAY